MVILSVLAIIKPKHLKLPSLGKRLSPLQRLLLWKRKRKWGSGKRKKKSGSAGHDGRSEGSGASARKCFQSGAWFPRDSGSRWSHSQIFVNCTLVFTSPYSPSRKWKRPLRRRGAMTNWPLVLTVHDISNNLMSHPGWHQDQVWAACRRSRLPAEVSSRSWCYVGIAMWYRIKLV